MTVATIAALIFVALVALWFWGRTPIIFRNLRPGGLMEHCDGLIRRGDGSKLLIRPESADFKVEVDKFFVSQSEIEISIIIEGYSDGAEKVVPEVSMCQYFDRLAAGPLKDKFALIFRIDRREEAAVSQLFKVLSTCLESLNRTIDRTYELFYRNKPIVGEINRSKYTERLSDPNVTDQQRRHAKAFLDELDIQLEKRIAAKNTELHKRLGKE